MNTFRSREKKMACFFLFKDLNMVWPTYCRSMKMKALKYSYRAGKESSIRAGSELKMLIRKCGAWMITDQTRRV